MKRHALFVGVNAYDDKTIRKLRYSIPDASVLEDRFKGFGYSTRLLADPTGAELKSAVMESVEGLGSGDVFLFFFAGHGFTSQDGAHLLFCRDDMQRLLRVNAAGTRVDAIEALTADGGFHRAFLLDSCRTDCYANVECRGGGTTRDLDFVSVPKCTKASGSFYLLRSCDKFRPSLEFDAIGHGLFTQGLLDAMDTRDNRLAYCDTSFATAIGCKMECLQRVHHVTDLQRPSIGEVSGPAFSLFDDDFILPAIRASQEPVMASPGYVVCPLCGKHNDIKDTFRCPDCGKDHLCLAHQSKDLYCCPSCVGKKAAETIELRLKDADRFYEDGRFQQAMALYEKCANEGNAHAQYMLGKMCDKGNGVEQNYGEAVKWYRKAAEQDDANAQCNLGICYEEGDGVEQDFAEAVKWFRKAVERGHARAQYNLGVCYDEGKGVMQDAAEAVRWYRKAAEHGDAFAQFNLGNMYFKGRGVAQSYEDAVKWYRKAAEQGDADAQINLGWVYQYGCGVEQSDADAALWYRKAGDQGREDAKQRLLKIQLQMSSSAVADEQTYYDVILKSFGSNKISVIATIREITGLGLVDAKEMVERAPRLVKELVSKETADDIAGKLRRVGAEVEVRCCGEPAMKKFVCPMCGYAHEGQTAPKRCPQCGTPGPRFEEVDVADE